MIAKPRIVYHPSLKPEVDRLRAMPEAPSDPASAQLWLILRKYEVAYSDLHPGGRRVTATQLLVVAGTPIRSSIDRLHERFESYVDRSAGPDACHPWSGGTNGTSGHGKFSIGSRRVYAHRVAWELANGQAVPKGEHVLHDCPGGDNPGCVNPRHLFLGSHADNMADASRKGSFRGERNGAAKLSRVDVEAIRAAAGRELQKETAARFGVSRQAVGLVQGGKRWQAER